MLDVQGPASTADRLNNPGSGKMSLNKKIDRVIPVHPRDAFRKDMTGMKQMRTTPTSAACVVVVAPPPPVVIEVDEPDQVVADQVVAQRPPVIVVRPIPQRIVTREVYTQAAQRGLDEREVDDAMEDSVLNEWHRRWTLQQEDGHSHPHDDNHHSAGQHESSSSFSSPTQDYTTLEAAELARAAGARNPSPDHEQTTTEQMFRTRKLDLLLQGRSFSSSEEEEDQPPLSKRPVIQEAPVAPVQTTSTSSQIFRPVAVRICRPVAVRPAYFEKNIPKHISRSYGCNMSPLTIPSVGYTSSRSKRSHLQIEDDTLMLPAAQAVPTVPVMINTHPNTRVLLDSTVLQARDGILQALAIAGGDVTGAQFQSCLATLHAHYQVTGTDTRVGTGMQGMWLALTKPTFFANLGDTDGGDPMYTLGRMSFDMFSPTNLVCSLQGNFNSVEVVSDEDRAGMLQAVPKKLREEVEAGETILRTYNIVTAFTIEPSVAAFPEAPNKDVRRPIRGIMTTKGYTLADPETPNRHSVWITGGKIDPNDDPIDQREWKRQFGCHPPKHGLGEQAKLLAVKLLMGATLPEKMDDAGCMSYEFTRPLGGHGSAYVETLYLDETLRVVKGHRGTVFVFTKMPGNN